MDRDKWRLVSIVAILTWILVGIYGVIFNISYIDEAKYLIKGWLIATGQIEYYSTPNFFYQHMPGGLLWFGLGQKLLGKSLLLGRIQSWLIGLMILFLSFKLGKKLGGVKTGIAALMLLSLMPVVILYYSSAVPRSLSVVMLLLGILSLTDKKYRWSSLWFSLSLVIRENFLFTLLIYLVWLFFILRKNWLEWLKNLLVVVIVLGIFFLPGFPEILNIFKNFPGISTLLPINQLEQSVLKLYWQKSRHDINLYIETVKYFGVIYFSWLVVAIFGIIKFIKQPVKLKKTQAYWFLIGVTGFNFLAHAWSAFNLSPKAIIGYMAYIGPLLCVSVAVLIGPKLKIRWIKTYILLLMIALIGMRFAAIFTPPNKQTDLSKINQSAKRLKPIVKENEKIVWLTEPISLYLADKISYYPLINHTNSYKPSLDTNTVRSLGFWNQEMMSQWLSEADLVVLDENRLRGLRQTELTKPVVKTITEYMDKNYDLLVINDYIWPGELSFFKPKMRLN